MLSRSSLMVLIVILSLFGPLSTDMYLSGLPVMVDEFGTNETVMNITLYAFMLSMAVSTLFLGPISDKYGRRKTLLATMAIYIVSSFACCIAPDVWTLIALRIVQAVGGGGAMCISIALIKDFFNGREMARVLSITSALGVLGPILAPVIGSILIGALDWKATFWLPAVIAIVCMYMSARLPGSVPENRYTGTVGGAISKMGEVARNGYFTAFTLMMTAFMASMLAYVSISSYIYQEDFGLSSGQYSLALAGTLVGGIVLMMVLQKAERGFLGRRILAVLMALAILSVAGMILIAHSSWAAFMVAMIPVSAVAMVGRSYGFDILMNQNDEDTGAVSSILNFSSFGLACVGMVIASMPWDDFMTGIEVTLVLCCGIYIVTWAVMRHGRYPLRGLED